MEDLGNRDRVDERELTGVNTYDLSSVEQGLIKSGSQSFDTGNIEFPSQNDMTKRIDPR